MNTWIKNLGFDTKKTLLLTGIYGFAGPISCFFAMIYLDRLPRVKMLYGGNFGLVAILSILTALTAATKEGKGNAGATGAAGIAMLFCYSIVYSATYGYVTSEP